MTHSEKVFVCFSAYCGVFESRMLSSSLMQYAVRKGDFHPSSTPCEPDGGPDVV